MSAASIPDLLDGGVVGCSDARMDDVLGKLEDSQARRP
jgi:hypothetical protein